MYTFNNFFVTKSMYQKGLNSKFVFSGYLENKKIGCILLEMNCQMLPLKYTQAPKYIPLFTVYVNIKKN